MSPYLLSYVYNDGVTAGALGWLMALRLIVLGLVAPFCGYFAARFGTRCLLTMACVTIIASQALSYFAVNNTAACFFTLGLMEGTGVGLALPLAMSLGSEWFPSRSGLVTGIVLSGDSIASALTAQTMSYVINPSNTKPTVNNGVAYFLDKGLLHPAPPTFLVMTGMVSVCAFVGLLLVQHPPIFYIELLPESDGATMPTTTSSCTEVTPEKTALMQSVHDVEELPLRAMIRKREFQLIYITYGCKVMIEHFLFSYVKLYGLAVIGNDTAVTITNSFASVFSIIGRMFWGALADRLGYQQAAAISCAMGAVVFFTMPLSVFGGIAFYSIWTVAMYFNFYGTTSVFVGLRENFGCSNAARNMGVVMSSALFSLTIVSTVATFALSVINFSGLLLFIGCFQFVAFVCVLLG